MGEKVNTGKLSFVSFEPKGQGFIAFLSMEGLVSNGRNPELILQDAANLYRQSIMDMRLRIDELKVFRATRKKIPARKIWQIGNIIFELKYGLEKFSFEIDGLYSHLVRDLGVKRKWLEKVIIFRRYLLKEKLIPKSLNWGSCEKGTRRVAKRLCNGLPLG